MTWRLYDMESGDRLEVPPTATAVEASLTAPNGAIYVDMATGDYVRADDVDTLLRCCPAPQLTVAYVLED